MDTLNKIRGLIDAVNRDQHQSSPASPPLVRCHIPSFQTKLCGSVRHLSLKCVTAFRAVRPISVDQRGTCDQNLGCCSSPLGVEMFPLGSGIQFFKQVNTKNDLQSKEN